MSHWLVPSLSADAAICQQLRQQVPAAFAWKAVPLLELTEMLQVGSTTGCSEVEYYSGCLACPHTVCIAVPD